MSSTIVAKRCPRAKRCEKSQAASGGGRSATKEWTMESPSRKKNIKKNIFRLDSVLFQGYCFFWVSKLIHHGFVSNFLRFWTIQWESSILYKVDESSQQEVANVKPVQRRSWQDTLLIPVVYYIYIYIDRLIMIHFYPIMYIWINYIYI